MIEALPDSSPPRGQVPIRAVLFDTFGTVVDFYHPMKRAFEAFARSRNTPCDPGRMAIAWRTAYIFSTFSQAIEESDFVPLREIHRQNLAQVLSAHLSITTSDEELDVLCSVWDKLDPWPDVVEGLQRIRSLAIIAPLSNGNFADMVRLSRYAALPWDIILGSSVSGFYKPHPLTYTQSVSALALQPGEVCMVAAHQADLAYAAGHGMQTAFVRRPDEFGGPVKPRDPVPGEDYMGAAEIHPEGEWTYLADDFLELYKQLREDSEKAS